MLRQLFLSFFKIGAFTFGGGYAMIPLIEREVTEKKHWIAKADFGDLLAVAQSSAGPISLNTAVFVGYKIRGFIGALAAVTGLVLPPFLIILLIAAYFPAIRQNSWVDAAFTAMRPAVVALMLWPVVSLAREIHSGLMVVVAIVALGIWGLHCSPIVFLLMGAGAGLLHAHLRKQRKAKP
ncbi:MAG: chromate transporter [Bacteroidales bacterium]|nr:chromate transporter [Bacteroidales bacterium]